MTTKCPTCGSDCIVGGERTTHYYFALPQTKIDSIKEQARNAGLEEAARVCDEQSKEPECPERAEYCAELIRALKRP